MIATRRLQRSFGDGLIAAEINDLHEAWMPHADAILADDEIVHAVHRALAKRHPQSLRRGRPGFPAEVVLRLLILKHARNWSYQELEREVRANLVYRDFTRIGAEKVPGRQSHGPVGHGSGTLGHPRGPQSDCANCAQQERRARAQDACRYHRGRAQYPLSHR